MDVRRHRDARTQASTPAQALRRLPVRAAVFDHWASTYDKSPIQRMVHEPLHRAVLDLALSEQPQPSAILDVGCGTGKLLRQAADTFPHVRRVGVDLSGPMLEYCADGESTTLVRARAENLPFRDEAFDLIFCTMSMLRWDEPVIGLAEVSRVCSPGGSVLIADAFSNAMTRRRWTRHRPNPDLRAAFELAGLSLRSASASPHAITSVTLLAARKPAH